MKFEKQFKYVVENYGLNSKQAYNMCIMLSIEKDKKYNKHAIQNYYNESIGALIEYIKQIEVNPNESIWNKYAVQNNYLSAESIGYIYGNGFNKLCKEIRKEIKISRKTKGLF